MVIQYMHLVKKYFTSIMYVQVDVWIHIYLHIPRLMTSLLINCTIRMSSIKKSVLTPNCSSVFARHYFITDDDIPHIYKWHVK